MATSNFYQSYFICALLSDNFSNEFCSSKMPHIYPLVKRSMLTLQKRWKLFICNLFSWNVYKYASNYSNQINGYSSNLYNKQRIPTGLFWQREIIWSLTDNWHLTVCTIILFTTQHQSWAYFLIQGFFEIVSCERNFVNVN